MIAAAALTGLASSSALAGEPPPAGSSTPAAPASPEASRAEALFQEGKSLLEQGNFTEACDRLSKSDTLDPAISTLGLLAACHEQLGRLATAVREFRETAKRAEAAGDSRAEFARNRADELEPKVPTITVRAPSPSPSMEILLAFERLTADKIGAAMLVDPGGYEIIARAPGMRELRWTIAVKEGAKLIIDLPALVPPDGPPYPPSAFPPSDAAPKPRASASAQASASPAPPPVAPPSSGLTSRQTAAIVSGGVAVVGIALGAGFGISAMNKNLKSESIATSCATRAACEEGKTLRADALQAATISTIGFGATAVGAAMTIILLALPSASPNVPARDATSRNLWIAPQIGAGEGGATVFGRF